MMENAGLSVETGPPDQLDQAFQLDFESNAELEAYEAEGLDFGLDGSYEEVEHIPAEQTPADAYAGFDDILTGHLPDDAAVEPELEPTGSEAHFTAIDDKTAQTTEATGDGNDADNDVKADVEYQDEIGYEDDELLATEANAELNHTEADETEAALGDALSEGKPAPVPVTDDGGHLEESLPGNDVSWDQNIDFQDHGESTEAQDPQHAFDDADAEETAGQQDGNDVSIDAFDDETAREQFTADYRGFDLEKVLDDITNPHTEVPEIEVLYNQECYSLFGNSDDDPDSYFLSGVEELDRPLSHFLSALRAVISDEVATTDELVIRFDPLDLEFGERSSEKFLNRSFREVLDCHSTLGQVSGMPADPVLHLTVRRDSEEHFLELLANAARANDPPSSAEDSEMSENHEEGSQTNDLDYEQAQDETFEDENLDEYHDEGAHADADHEEKVEFGSAPSDDDASGEQEKENQFDATAPQPSDTAGASSEGEEHFEIPSAEGLSHDTTDDGVDEEQAWDEQATGGDNGAVLQDPEIPVEETDEVNQKPTEQQGDEIPEASDGVAAPNDGVSEQETGSNDDDLILAFDDEPGLSSIHEGAGEHEEDTITYDDPENLNNDAEDVEEPLAAGTSNEYVVEHSENGGHGTAVAETASVHTSTTMNGDEIDYDEDDAANGAFTPANDDAQQLAAASGDGKDEIDWENDEDEYEQQPAIENAGADYEESKEAPPTPPSVAGKRSRADETESLADETDYKRRRT
jgi:hypothetical protein